MWRIARGLSLGACKRVRLTGGAWERVFAEAVNIGVIEGAWRCVTAFLVSNFFGFCRSKAVEDRGIVSFLKLWADLHRFEGLGRGSFERSWLRLGCVAGLLGLIFLGFVDRRSMDLVVALVL